MLSETIVLFFLHDFMAQEKLHYIFKTYLQLFLLLHRAFYFNLPRIDIFYRYAAILTKYFNEAFYG
jgi:hypothetical protein